MFELKIENAKYWRDCVESIVSLVDEGLFNITPEGISLKAMDPSSISMVSFTMPAKAFAKYSVDKPTSVGVNLENLSKILSRTRDGESLVMRDVDNKLLLEFIGQGTRRRYKLQMIDVKKNSDKEPSIQFDSHVEMVGEPFKDIIKDAGLLSSYISFKASKDQFAVTARGDAGELESLHEKNSALLHKMTVDKNAEATFNLEFLENMVKSCPVGTHIKIEHKTNEPLKLSYNIGEASITYYLAPYMEE